MNTLVKPRGARVGVALAALAAGIATVASPTAALAQPRAYSSGTYRPSTQVLLSVGEGQMINLPRSVASVWTSNPDVADVYMNGGRQMNLFGKKAGESTVIATAAEKRLSQSNTQKSPVVGQTRMAIIFRTVITSGHRRASACAVGGLLQRSVQDFGAAGMSGAVVMAAPASSSGATKFTRRSTSLP